MSNDENTGVFGSISKYAVSTVADKDAYTDLRAVAVAAQAQFPNSPADAAYCFQVEYAEGEIEFMEVNYSGDPDAKHKTGKRAGQWKVRAYLPNGYNSAKIELRKGLEAGLDPTGMGKTALHNARTAATKVERTVEERIDDYLGKLVRALNSVDDSAVRQSYRETCMRGLSIL